MMFWLIRYNVRTPEIEDMGDLPEMSFSAPAKDGVYDFDITVHTSWAATGARRSHARPDPDERDHICRRIRAETRTIAHEHSPFSPGEAEQDINVRLDRALREMTNHDNRVLLRWSACAEVSLSEEVRQLQRERTRRLHQIESDAAAVELQARKAEDARLAWERFLAQASQSRYVRYAMRLAEQPHVTAQVVAEMLDDNQETAAHFLDRLDKLVTAQQRSNVYDLVVGSESALRDAMRALGLPVPPIDADPFLPNGSGRL